jgi:hypothetical protein
MADRDRRGFNPTERLPAAKTLVRFDFRGRSNCLESAGDGSGIRDARLEEGPIILPFGAPHGGTSRLSTAPQGSPVREIDGRADCPPPLTWQQLYVARCKLTLEARAAVPPLQFCHAETDVPFVLIA